MSLRPHALALLAVACACRAAPALDEAGCRLETDGAPAVFAECSHLTVPEDPDAPDGATVSLFVARVPALTAAPARDPLVLIAGGPGQSTVDFYLQLKAAFDPARRDRDIILLDQRGTGRSADGYACEAPDDVELPTAGSAEIDTLVQQCLGSLERDPRFLTTSVAVRDLERLRASLGAEQWNLYGVSYGTRVAQHYLRRYPNRVRAVILDGVVPPDRVLGPDTARNAQAALDGIFARCAADTACAERFGDLSAKFAQVRADVAAGPIELNMADPESGRLGTSRFSEPKLEAAVRLMSYSAPTVALLPLVIDLAADGNYRPLAAQAELLAGSLSGTLSFAMQNSVICTEDFPLFGSDADDSGEGTYLGTTIVDALRRICARWPRGPLDDDFAQPVRSDRPVLLLSGQYDPATPPAYAEHVVATGLTNAIHLIGPGQGHGQAAVGCVPQLMRDFLAAPGPSSVDGACLEAEPPTPFFLSLQGPAP